MRIIILFSVLAIVYGGERWSWSKSDKPSSKTKIVFETPVKIESTQSRSSNPKTRKPVATNFNRQPRKISQAVPPAKSEPRTLKDKLCKHGLAFNCHKGVEFIEIAQPYLAHPPPPPPPPPVLPPPPRPHYGGGINPNHVLHVQPVALQPVGTPVQAVPLGYGPPGSFGGHSYGAPPVAHAPPVYTPPAVPTYPQPPVYHQPQQPVYAPQAPYVEIDFSEPETVLYEEDTKREEEPQIVKHYHTHIHKSDGTDYTYGRPGNSGRPPRDFDFYSPSNNIYHYSREKCDCVPVNFCPPRDIVGRSDRYPLIDARNKPTNVISSAKEDLKSKSKTPKLSAKPKTKTTKRSKRAAAKFPDSNQRTIGSRIQSSFSSNQCRRDEVCCRSSEFSGRRITKSCGYTDRTGITARVKNNEFKDRDTHFGEHPWQVAILKKESGELIYVCGATLISDRHILTAGHCVNGVNANELTARLGEWDVNRKTEYYNDIETQVDKITVHPSFYSGTMENDIAVVTLSSRISIDKHSHITPACLPSRFDDFTNQHCHVTGWGKDAFGNSGRFQHILKEVELPVWGHSGCESAMRNTRLGRDYKLHKGMLCAGGEEGKDACEGDGGSPLVCSGKGGAKYLTGIVSWGLGCGRRGIPGVYVNVAYYYDWIEQTMG